MKKNNHQKQESNHVPHEDHHKKNKQHAHPLKQHGKTDEALEHDDYKILIDVEKEEEANA